MDDLELVHVLLPNSVAVYCGNPSTHLVVISLEAAMNPNDQTFYTCPDCRLALASGVEPMRRSDPL